MCRRQVGRHEGRVECMWCVFIIVGEYVCARTGREPCSCRIQPPEERGSAGGRARLPRFHVLCSVTREVRRFFDYAVAWRGGGDVWGQGRIYIALKHVPPYMSAFVSDGRVGEEVEEELCLISLTCIEALSSEDPQHFISARFSTM